MGLERGGFSRPPLIASGSGARLLLGTAGGSVYYPDQWRRGMASAVVVGDAVYLIDCGEGAATRFRQAELGPSGFRHGFDNLRAIFFTHLHSDHTVGYPGILVAGLFNGVTNVAKPVQVFGPGQGVLTDPPISERAPSRVVNPQNPMPGTVDLTRGIFAAYARDLNERLRSPTALNPETLFDPHDIVLPAGADADPSGQPSPEMDPFAIYEDENVRVTATLVDHRPCFPAFGFRFDMSDGSIAFSGDTRPTDNVVRLSRNTQILVHEVVCRPALDRALTEPALRARLDAIVGYHTTVEEVDRVASVVRPRVLVLSPVMPPNVAEHEFRAAAPTFTGEVVVGQDLDQITVRG